MSATMRQRILLGGLAAALAAAVWVQTRPAGPAAGQATAPARPSASPRGQRAVEASGPTPVRLDALAASRREPTTDGRNPFRFQQRGGAPAAGRAPSSKAAAADAAPAAVTTPAPPALPPGPPPPPPIPLKFIGVVQRANGVKWAVLSDSRTTMYGREGDIIDGQYLIVKIGLESIELSLADGRGRQTLRLSGQ